MSLLAALSSAAVPPEEFSRWYCNVPACDGEPHGPHWHWCSHPVQGPHDQTCRHARRKQRPPEGDWFVWLMLAGRGFGKSRSAAEWLVHTALHRPPAEWATIARTSDDVRKNARDFHAGLVTVAGGLVEHGGHVRQYNRHENDLYLDNGAVIHCLSADKPDKLRGYNLAGGWADELAAWTRPETWDMLLLALREGEHTQVVVTTTPKPVPLVRGLVEKGRDPANTGYVLTTGSLFENATNLAPNFVAEMRSTYEGTRLGRQELEGELMADVAGALVSWEMINDARLARDEVDHSTFTRVVVAVDPAVSYDPERRSDETGIVVCARDRAGHGYVLADLSCKKSPREWASVAVSAYERFGADRIVAEKNQGHGLVEEVVRSVAPHIPYKGIQAQTSKRLRAEPITALYEQGRVHHVGTFSELENQLCVWEPDSRMKSPDRMDALVHGMTELGLARTSSFQGYLEFMGKLRERREGQGGTVERHMRSLAAAQSRAEASEERRRQRCSHRFRAEPPHRCVRCGMEEPIAAV